MIYNFIALKQILKFYQTQFPLKSYNYNGKRFNQGVELSIQGKPPLREKALPSRGKLKASSAPPARWEDVDFTNSASKGTAFVIVIDALFLFWNKLTFRFLLLEGKEWIV